MVLARGAALFLGTFVLLGLLGEWRGRQTNVELWFVDLRDLMTGLRIALLGAFGALAVVWSVVGGRLPWLRRAATVVTLAFVAFALRDALRFQSAVAGGLVRPALPVPLSALVAVLLVGLAGAMWLGARTRDPGEPNRADRPSWRHGSAILVGAAGWALLFPVLQMAFFGTTDYRRPANAAVVFGARVYASGAPSPLLADRIAAGVELYRSGDVSTLLMSGGDGVDGFNEAAVMRDVAVAAGVDPNDVVIDGSGVTTEATVDHAMAWLASHGSVPISDSRLIAVSQAYHLPRIQLAFAAAGIDVLTVPAVDPVPISEMPLLVAREIPAFWTYYLRQCLG